MSQEIFMSFSGGFNRLKQLQEAHYQQTAEYLDSFKRVIGILKKHIETDGDIDKEMGSLSLKIDSLFEEYAQFMRDLKRYGALRQKGGLDDLLGRIEDIITDVKLLCSHSETIFERCLKLTSLPSEFHPLLQDFVKRSSKVSTHLTDDTDDIAMAYAQFTSGFVMIEPDITLRAPSKRKQSQIGK